MNREPLRRNLLGGLLAFLFLLAVWVVAAIHLTGAAASPLQVPPSLASSLSANYGKDPIGGRIYELRLSIVQELGPDRQNRPAGSIPDSLKELMSQPVPTATPQPPSATPIQVRNEMTTATPPQAPTAAPTSVASPTPQLSKTPTKTPTPAGGPALGPIPDCSQIRITAMWVDSHDEVRAQVRNDNNRRAYLTTTVFKWPDVPPPAYVDWMRLDDRYYDDDDFSSPTISEGSWVSINKNSAEIWKVDFDDAPSQGIYGSFHLTLTFEYPDWGSCVIEGSTFRAQPTPSPTKTPSPTRTPTSTKTPAASSTTPPTATKTPTPGVLPSATLTSTVEPTVVPSETPTAPADTATPEPTAAIPEPTATT